MTSTGAIVDFCAVSSPLRELSPRCKSHVAAVQCVSEARATRDFNLLAGRDSSPVTFDKPGMIFCYLITNNRSRKGKSDQSNRRKTPGDMKMPQTKAGQFKPRTRFKPAFQHWWQSGKVDMLTNLTPRDVQLLKPSIRDPTLAVTSSGQFFFFFFFGGGGGGGWVCCCCCCCCSCCCLLLGFLFVFVFVFFFGGGGGFGCFYVQATCLYKSYQGRICSDKCTCCHSEIEVAEQTFYLTHSQYTDTGQPAPALTL